MRVVYVEWIDAASSAGWTDIKDFQKDNVHHCKSIGFVLQESKDSLTLASCVSQHQANATISIPKAWIKKRRIVKVP